MTRFDWRHATAWTGAPVCFGATLGLLAFALWHALDRLRSSANTRWTLLEILALLALAMWLSWLAALCRATANRRRIMEEPSPSIRRVIVTPPSRGAA